MVEEYVLSRIHKKYRHAFIRDGRHKEWDIYVPEIKTKVEVKSDVYSNKTGNFVVEVEYGGRPSGLTTSTADFWVFFTGYKLIWIRREHIYRAISEAEIPKRKFVGGSDKKEKTAHLVSVALMEQYATKIDYPLNDLPSNFNFRPERRD